MALGWATLGAWLSLAILAFSSQPTYASDETCAIVIDTPDGFLSVREKPDTSSKRVSRARPGQVLIIDGHESNWAIVVGERRANQKARFGNRTPLNGYVHQRYLRWIDCEKVDYVQPSKYPWSGVWAANKDVCRSGQPIGEHPEAPIRITDTETTGLESFCDIQRVWPPSRGETTWQLLLGCSVEGTFSRERITLQVTLDDTLVETRDDGTKVKWIRCTTADLEAGKRLQDRKRQAARVVTGKPEGGIIELEEDDPCIVSNNEHLAYKQFLHFRAVDVGRAVVRAHRGLYFVELAGDEVIERTESREGRAQESNRVWVPDAGFRTEAEAMRHRDVTLKYLSQHCSQ